MAYATTSKGRESTSSTVKRAKKMLKSSLKKTGGSVKKGNTSRSRLAEIANQDFVTDKNRRDLVSSGAITADSLSKRDVADIPQAVAPTSPAIDLAYNNAGLGETGTDGLFTFNASEGAGAGEIAATNSMNALGSQLGDYLGIAKPDANANENAIADAREQAGVKAAQDEYNRYQNQINTITARRDAQQLGLEGQGRGITDTIIGGQQARIGREAAIQALPIQAQLAAAQGNLEQAKELMGQLYQAKSADIQADQTYRTNLANSMMSFATTAQQTILQGLNADNAQKAQTAQQNLAYQRQLGMQAIEFGQSGLATGMAGVDPSSPNFESEMAEYTAKLFNPANVVDTGTAGGDWKLATVNGESMWVNASTQEVRPVSGDGTPPKSYADEKVTRTRQVLGELMTIAVDNEGIFGKSAAVPWPDFARSEDFRNYKAKLKTLSSSIAFGELTEMREASKTGGALGQVSERELALLESSLGAINMSQSPTQVKAELKKIDDSLIRWQAAKKGVEGVSGGGMIVTAPDDPTVEIEIIPSNPQ